MKRFDFKKTWTIKSVFVFLTALAFYFLFSISTGEIAFGACDNATAFCKNGNSFGSDATLGTNDNFSLRFETNNQIRTLIDPAGNTFFSGNMVQFAPSAGSTFFSNVGIGGLSSSLGKLEMYPKQNLPTLLFRYPCPVACSLPDPNYAYQAAIQWEGGESKFGKWRQYFNGYENSWTLAYNAPWSYTNNTWGGRDSGHPSANVVSLMRFDVAEGNSGQNFFEVKFAPPAAAGVIPDFNAAANYNFYDGRSELPAMPAQFKIRAAHNMDAMITLIGNATVVPVNINLIADGANPSPKLFRIQNGDTGVDLLEIKTDTGNVGVGTTKASPPNAKLHVAGGDVYTSTAGNGIILKSPDGATCRRVGINNGGTMLLLTPVTCP